MRTKEKKYRNECHKRTFTTKFITRFSEIRCSSQTMRAFLSHTRVFSMIVCVMFFFMGRVETESCFFFAYAVRIASMILRTARFLSVTYGEICVNATAEY